jgi:hypothetical protein
LILAQSAMQGKTPCPRFSQLFGNPAPIRVRQLTRVAVGKVPVLK